MLYRPDVDCIRIENEWKHARMTFNFPFLITDMTLADMKKSMKLILEWSEEEHIPVIEEWFKYLIEEARDLWEANSKKFVDEYKDADYYKRDPKVSVKEIKHMRAHNSTLKDDVRRSKSTYEKLLKRHEAFKELKVTKGY